VYASKLRIIASLSALIFYCMLYRWVCCKLLFMIMIIC